jgi:hypothetical protein
VEGMELGGCFQDTRIATLDRPMLVLVADGRLEDGGQFRPE